MSEEYAVVLVRGLIGLRSDVRDTLTMLRLRKKHAAVIVPADPVRLGMLEKIKDVATYGPVSGAVAKALSAKMKDGVAHLPPPRGGFGRKGVKASFAVGGALGKRDSMDKLLGAMLQ
jgi:large subunit ribosomal protein L30